VARALALLLLFLGPAPAHAHPANVATAAIVIGDRDVQVALSANLFELDLVLALDRDLDAAVDLAELERRRADIVDYLRRTVSVEASGAVLAAEVGPFAIARGADGRALFETSMRFRSARALGPVVIRCAPLTELGADHTTLARITTGGTIAQFAFRQGVTYERGTGWPGRLGAFVRLGVVHIFTGWDHLAFLVGLLLAGGRLLTILGIVTAFTLAHSLTLSLAVLGLVTLPPALVEAGIAVSIVYVALENLLWPAHDWRWLVSFLFGLVHGFGFAGILAEMHLPRTGLALALAAFNIGVELGQIAVVLLVVPAVWWLARTHVHLALTRSLSALLLVLGLVWLWERAL
jgi:hypothetical protein